MRWITREKPKIDRLACPWLIKRFIEPAAEIIYVPYEQVITKAAALKAIPFDIPRVEHTHYDNFCTFDYFIKKYEIKDNAVQKMAVVIRGQTPITTSWQCSGPGFWPFLPAWRIIFPTTWNYWKMVCLSMMHSTAGPNTCKKKNIPGTKKIPARALEREKTI